MRQPKTRNHTIGVLALSPAIIVGFLGFGLIGCEVNKLFEASVVILTPTPGLAQSSSIESTAPSTVTASPGASLASDTISPTLSILAVTLTASHTPTRIPTRGPAATLTASATPLPTVTLTAGHTPTRIPTRGPAATLTASATPTPTFTLTAGHTPTRIPTQGPTATLTASATPIPSDTPEPPVVPTATQPVYHGPTLEDYWNGTASWQLDVSDVGLPMGESDTILGPDGQLWSYLHASFQSAQIRDQWNQPVEFPGCVTLWKSVDGGQSFSLTQPTCLIKCRTQPCSAQNDQIDQQQYPRVVKDTLGHYHMVYEWRGEVYARSSRNGLDWSLPSHIPGTGVWTRQSHPCPPFSEVGFHPFVGDTFPIDCLVGAPPGLFVDGSQIYVFVALGQNPGKMGCFVGNLLSTYDHLQPCAWNPLFWGAPDYGPLDERGASTRSFFDFRSISSADILKVNDHYYMTYEGVRGPSSGDPGDTQFGLGLARSVGSVIDGPWEKFPGNPIIRDVPGNIGVGHADLVVINGNTYLYTATSNASRGRHILAWK